MDCDRRRGDRHLLGQRRRRDALTHHLRAHAESPWKQATASTFSGEPQIYHHTCESIEVHLSVVFAAIAA
jgi:hypothetical protein